MAGGAGAFIGGGGGALAPAIRFGGAFLAGGGGAFTAGRLGAGGFFRASRFAGAFFGAVLDRSTGLGGGLPMVGGGAAARLGLPSLVPARRGPGGRSRKARALGGRKRVLALPLPIFLGGVRTILCPGR